MGDHDTHRLQPSTRAESQYLANVISAAFDVHACRAMLVDAMTEAIKAGVAPEKVAVAAMRSEVPYNLMSDAVS